MTDMEFPSYPKTPSFQLEGKRALVAGASSGIGLGCAIALAEQGAQVSMSARSEARLEAVVGELKTDGLDVASLPMDVSKVEETREIVAEQGPFDILVNSAGIARHGPFLETSCEDFDDVMRVNLRGAYFLSQSVARGLHEAGRPGSLIHISSQMGHVGGQERAVYCASKFAMEGFTRAMAIELGPAGIRVNTICPTFILTPLTEPTFRDPEKREWIRQKIKLDRVGMIEDVMGAVIYLASDASRLVTGSAMMVDGGWTAG